MEIRIVWSQFALNELHLIHQFYSNKASLKIADKLIDGILTESKRLSKNPKIGTFEHSLGMNEILRYLVIGNFKLIYEYRNNRVEILDVFDTRRNPKNILNKTRS